MMRFLGRRLLPLAALLAACGGNVVVDAEGAGGAGGQGGGGPGSSTSSSTSTGVGGAGGSAQCGQSWEPFVFTLVTWDGQIIDCGSADPGGSSVFTLQGEMIQLSPTSYQIDSCPPNADCAPMISTLTMESPGFSPSVPPLTFVDLTVNIDFPWGCSQTLLARNLPEWGGVASPGGSLPTLLFAGSEGTLATPGGSPFAVEGVSLGCYPDVPPETCGKPEDYALHFWQPENPGDPGLTLAMGDTGSWQTVDHGVPVTWIARNLKSFETGWCDDYWNWGWWVTLPATPD